MIFESLPSIPYAAVVARIAAIPVRPKAEQLQSQKALRAYLDAVGL